MYHIRILARDPPTTKSEDFSLLCYPAWGDSPFLSDLDTLSYEKLPMSTPGLRWTRHPHPGNSHTPRHTTHLTTHDSDRSFLLQVDATQPSEITHTKQQYIYTTWTPLREPPATHFSHTILAHTYSYSPQTRDRSELGRTLDTGHWTLDTGHWTLTLDQWPIVCAVGDFARGVSL
jgi:hypothetical protein